MNDVDLVSLLSVLGGALDGRVRAALLRAGHQRLRTPHGYVFQQLLDGPSTASELARDLAVSQQAVSKLVGELERAGYVERVPDPTDARRRPVALTPRAQASIETARRARAELVDTLLGGSDAADVATTRRVLEQAIDSLGLSDRVAARRLPLPE